MIEFSHYEKFQHPTAKVKFYRPILRLNLRQTRGTKRLYKTATKSIDYGKRLAARYNRRCKEKTP